MTAGNPVRRSRRQARRDLTLVLLLGAAGAGLALLATRQVWARAVTAAPRPLPASVTTVTGQALVPAAGALALAALACLAAVLATRRTLRRIAGVVLAGLGAGLAIAACAGISPADVLAAASAAAGPQGGPGGAAGSGVGSTTAGLGTSGAPGSPLSGLPAHVAFVSFPWRGAALLGALAVIAAGTMVTWRAARLPVMTSRFDRPARPAAGEPALTAADRGGQGRDPAAIWESLSRGEDPTGPD